MLLGRETANIPEEGWNPDIHSYQTGQEYLFDLAADKWNRFETTNPNKFDLSYNTETAVVLSFFPIAKNILSHSGMIHLLFDPNELFSPDGPLFDKRQEFLDKGLVIEEEGKYFWVYPGDLLSATPQQTQLLAYSYFDIDIFEELLDGGLSFPQWIEGDDARMGRVSIYAQLGLPADFDLETFISNYLSEFPDFN